MALNRLNRAPEVRDGLHLLPGLRKPGGYGAQAVPLAVVGPGDEPAAPGELADRMIGLVTPTDDQGLIIGAVPNTPALEWITRVGAEVVARELGMRAASQQDLDAFIARAARLMQVNAAPYGVLDASHSLAARRGLRR